MRIGPVDLDHEVLVVAEIGNNHEGDSGSPRSSSASRPPPASRQ